MNRLTAGAVAGPLLLQTIAGMGVHATALPAPRQPSACKPSPTVLHAAVAPVSGLSPQQIQSATTIINAGAPLHVPEHGQTIAVMAALEDSDLQSPPGGSAVGFYQALTKVKGWQNMPPTLAAHAAEHNLDPQAYARWWPRAVTVVSALTTGTGVAGVQNLAARAQAIADCTAATVRGRFAVSGVTNYVGPVAPALLDSRAQDLARNGGSVWYRRCQAFVAILDGRPFSGYSTALDAWQTFEANGVAHPVTSADGVAPPIGAWLYYTDSTNPAGHVATYLGNGQIASTDVFAEGRVGIGPASAITNGPWRMQYLGWAPPWGGQ